MNKMLAISNYNVAVEHSTLSKLDQIILLYGAIISHTLMTQSAIVSKDYNEAYSAMVKCQKIIDGLSISLDMENGGEVAKVLQKFYNEIGLALYQSIIKKEPKYCDFVITQVSALKSSWEEIKERDNNSSNPI